MPTLVEQIKASVREAMKAKNKGRLGTLRFIQSEFKRVEVDERIEIDDARALVILDKMLKQRRDSAEQYRNAGRDELEAQELFEIAVISEFLPEPLSESDIDELVKAAIADSGASGMQAMGAVMASIKPQVQGRADMAEVSKRVKALLA
ncbi:MAG: hypothetical protein RI942_648 [Pseudomonadota bacterium]|jgi:uncharacterized protein YqeY